MAIKCGITGRIVSGYKSQEFDEFCEACKTRPLAEKPPFAKERCRYTGNTVEDEIEMAYAVKA